MLNERTVQISQIELEIAKDGKPEKGDLRRLKLTVKEDGVVVPLDWNRYYVSIEYEGDDPDCRVIQMAVCLALNTNRNSRGDFYLVGRRYWKSKYWIEA